MTTAKGDPKEDIDLDRVEGGGAVSESEDSEEEAPDGVDSDGDDSDGDDSDTDDSESEEPESEESEDAAELIREWDVLAERRDGLEGDIEQARKDERKELLGTKRWDLERDERREIKGTWHFNQGDDWTEEEKAALRAAWKELGQGALQGACAALMNAFGSAAAVAGQQAAHARLDNATADDRAALEFQATAADLTVGGATAVVAATASNALMSLLWGVRSYWSVCTKHAERLKNLNNPPSTVRREELERYAKELDERLAKIEARLKRLVEQATDEADRMERGEADQNV